MSWRENAACLGMSQTIFFPDNRKFDAEHCATARAICAACPVKEPCLAEALKVAANDDGIFAGTTPWQRGRMRRSDRKETKYPAICQECEEPFERINARSRAACCSELCRVTHERRRMREDHQMRRGTLPRSENTAHGRIAKYGRGCRCAACRSVARARQRDARLKAREAA